MLATNAKHSDRLLVATKRIVGFVLLEELEAEEIPFSQEHGALKYFQFCVVHQVII